MTPLLYTEDCNSYAMYTAMLCTYKIKKLHLLLKAELNVLKIYNLS